MNKIFPALRANPMALRAFALAAALLLVAVAFPPTIANAQSGDAEELPPAYRLSLEKENVERYYTVYGIGMGATIATGVPGPAIMAVSGDLVLQSAERYARILEKRGAVADSTQLESYRRSHNAGLVTAGLGSVTLSAGAGTFAYGDMIAEDDTFRLTGAIIAGAGAVATLTGLIIDAVAVTRTRDWVRERNREMR
ncbi:MAG: hypothetical protein GVY23_09755 [Spirochaetes bacterium]|jgi:hypothetical protein|nr:hypothetical protein [Spirochaetota bacterium]